MNEFHIVVDRLTDPWELPVVLLVAAALWVYCWRQANHVLRGGLGIIAVVALFYLSQDARVRLGDGLLATNGELQNYYDLYASSGSHIAERCALDKALAGSLVQHDRPNDPASVVKLARELSTDRCYREEKLGAFAQSVSTSLVRGKFAALSQIEPGRDAEHFVVLSGAMMGDSPDFIGRLLIAGRQSRPSGMID